MANTGLRPDEVKLLEFRDVEIVEDEYSGQRILEIEVRGKRGVGYCKSMPGAVRPFERLLARERPAARNSGDDNPEPVESRKPEPTDRLFPNEFKKMFNGILTDAKLKFDRNGKARTAYSLRHSYICFRLLEGADIYQVAKNCRTSVEMIEKHYAAHLSVFPARPLGCSDALIHCSQAERDASPAVRASPVGTIGSGPPLPRSGKVGGVSPSLK